MPPRRPIPTSTAFSIKKADILNELKRFDSDPVIKDRILLLETGFRTRISSHIAALPLDSAEFKAFNTNPFVLMAYCKNKGYSKVSQIEKDIVPAKLFSSMETSAGRMVEDIALPIYGWGGVPSGMHSINSALDGLKIDGPLLRLATLKSGPRCLNDEMSENFADQILTHYKAWADTSHCAKIDFTYGVLYGTQKISNKKDWHILRNVKEKLSGGVMTVSPDGRWDCAFTKNGIDVTVTIRIGRDWWAHLGKHPSTYLEICIALIRSCVALGEADPPGFGYTISDLAAIVSTASVPATYNVALLQKEQLPWLFFLARHFCDNLTESSRTGSETHGSLDPVLSLPGVL